MPPEVNSDKLFTIGCIVGYCTRVIVTSRQELFTPAADEIRLSIYTASYLDKDGNTK